MRIAPTLLLIALLTAPAVATEEEPTPAPLVNEATSAAIERGLAWLGAAQREDGSFPGWVGFKRNDDYIPETGDQVGHAGLTALAAVAFMAAGAVPGEGERGEALARALDSLVSMQDEGGMVTANGTRMDSHGLALYALATARRLQAVETRDRCMTRAAVFSAKAQNLSGGWDYVPFSRDADVIVTSGQVLALLAARDAKLRVPDRHIDAALEYILRCAVRETGAMRGMFAYRWEPLDAAPAQGTWGQTAIAFHALTHAGFTDEEKLLDFIEKREVWRYGTPRLADTVHAVRRGFDTVPRRSFQSWFGIYHAARALHARGGEEFEAFYRTVRDDLTRRQRDDGSWALPAIGDVFGTAVALTVLQLPRNDLPTIPR